MYPKSPKKKFFNINKNLRTLSPRGNYERSQPEPEPEPENSYDLRTQPTSAVPGTRRDVPKDARNVVTEEQFFLQFNYGKNVEQNEKDIRALDNLIIAADTTSRDFNARDYQTQRDAINDLIFLAADLTTETNLEAFRKYSRFRRRVEVALAGPGDLNTVGADALAFTTTTLGVSAPRRTAAGNVAVAIAYIRPNPDAHSGGERINAFNARNTARNAGLEAGIRVRTLEIATLRTADPEVARRLLNMSNHLNNILNVKRDFLSSFTIARLETYISALEGGGDFTLRTDLRREVELIDTTKITGEMARNLISGSNPANRIYNAKALKEIIDGRNTAQTEAADDAAVLAPINIYFRQCIVHFTTIQTYLDAKRGHLEEVSRPLVTQKNALIEKQYDAGKRRSKKRKSRRRSATKRRSSSKKRSATKRRSSSKKRSATKRRSSSKKSATNRRRRKY